jgi:hypothetical protein
MTEYKMSWWLKLALLSGIAFLIFIYMEWDRILWLKLANIEGLLEHYQEKQTFPRRISLILECDEGLCLDTLKSLIDQSIKVDDIAVQTNHSENFREYKKLNVITIHAPGTEELREGDANTLIIHVDNGRIYGYSEIEDIANHMIRTEHVDIDELPPTDDEDDEDFEPEVIQD